MDGSSAAAIARSGVALVPEGRRLFGPEPIADNLLLGGWVRGRSRSELDADREAMYERFPVLGARRKQPAASLSGGEAQMLAIAMALMARPRVLLLDEPSLGLAPRLVAEVMELTADLARQGVTVLLVEQMVNQALTVADRVAVLGRGRIVAPAHRTRSAPTTPSPRHTWASRHMRDLAPQPPDHRNDANRPPDGRNRPEHAGRRRFGDRGACRSGQSVSQRRAPCRNAT